MEERNALADSGTLQLHIGHNTCCFLKFFLRVPVSLYVCACECDEIDTLILCGSYGMGGLAQRADKVMTTILGATMGGWLVVLRSEIDTLHRSIGQNNTEILKSLYPFVASTDLSVGCCLLVIRASIGYSSRFEIDPQSIGRLIWIVPSNFSPKRI